MRRQAAAQENGLTMRRAMLQLLNVFRREAAERELTCELVAHMTPSRGQIIRAVRQGVADQR